MKIAHVTSELCRASAGLGVAVASISAATQQAGNEVRVFGLSSAGWKGGDRAAWSGAQAEVFDKTPWSGSFGYAPRLLPALMAFEPDVVHLHGLWTYPSIAAHRWYKSTGRPLIISAHGMLFTMSLAYKPLRKGVARRIFQNRVLRDAAVLHATSADEAVSYHNLGFTNRTALIPLGLQPVTLPTVNRDGTPRRVLYLGRLHHQKGLDWLSEAWSQLEHAFPNWGLSVVGPIDQSFARQLEQIRSKLVGKRVTFLEPLFDGDKYSYMAGSDLFVMPSRSENFGLTAAEALMMEVPVIATKGTPWSGLVDAEAGWWIDSGPIALEQAMREAMQLSEAELRRKGRNGRRWMERDFSNSATGSKWLELYETLKPS